LVAELIMLDGQILNGSDRLGDWKTSSLEGWWDSPDAKGEDVERAGADGDFDLEVFYTARYITITGRLFSPGHTQLHDAMNRFAGLVQKQARLQVSGHGPAQWADVKRASGLSMVPVTDTFAQWQLRLKAPDARKFGDANTFTATVGASVVASHWGNYPAKPRFEVTGSMPGGYVLTVGGQQFMVMRALASGTPHTINYDDSRLRIGGVVIHGGLGATATPGILPGSAATVSIAPLTTGTATATLTLLDTYI
jgi:hypothetical protein